MAYNTTNLTAAVDIYDMAKGVNDLTGSLFIHLLLALIFIVLMAFMSFDEWMDRIIASSFITTVIAAGFYVINLCSVYALSIPFLILIISLFIKIFTRT